MTNAARCTYNTRLAGWMSALVATATFAFLHSAYERLPIVVPISFEAGSPLSFAAKSPELVYLPFGLQLALGAVFAAVVAVVLGRRHEDATITEQQRRAVAEHTAEGVALIATVWIAFQAVNAWRLTELWGHMFDPFVEDLRAGAAHRLHRVARHQPAGRRQGAGSGCRLPAAADAGARRATATGHGRAGRPTRPGHRQRRWCCCRWSGACSSRPSSLARAPDRFAGFRPNHGNSRSAARGSSR